MRTLRPLFTWLQLVLFSLLFIVSFPRALAQDLGAKLPLVTAGTSLGWMPSGDEVEFTLPERAWIKLSIYSPTLDLIEVGDELYSGNLESTFRFSDAAGIIRQETFQLASSAWVTFYEGPLDASRYVLRSDVTGKGKNVYLLRLETSLPEIPLEGYSTTVNVSSFDYQDAFSFDLNQNASCAIELYDGDGAAELEAQLIQPTGFIQAMTVSEDLSTITQPLPRLQGTYTVQLRLTYGAYQKTNSVRFSLVCQGEPQLVTLVPPVFVAPQLNPILVEVVDTAGNPLSIPYTVSEGFERDVTLGEHPEYTLVEVRPEGGQHIAERTVRFGVEGGKVTFVLDNMLLDLEVPRPEPTVQLLPVQPLPLPEVSLIMPERSRLSLTREFSASELLLCQPLRVTFRVRNEGDSSGRYLLREVVPAGFVLREHGGAMLEESGVLIWQGEVEPGQEVVHQYLLEVAAPEAAEARFNARLESDQEPLLSEAVLPVYSTPLNLKRVYPEGSIYAGDEIQFELMLDNPLTRDLTLHLVPAYARLTILEAPETLEIPAGGSVRATVRAEVSEAGVAVLQFTPYACDPSGLSSGSAVTWREEALRLPELPTPLQSTTITIDMAAYQLPVIDGLVLVHPLRADVSYLSGSTRINQQMAADPMQASTAQGTYLVFELPDSSVATLSFTVLHQAAYKADLEKTSLVALTPRPEVLIGDAEALRYYQEAVPIEVKVAARERSGSIILSPPDQTLIRDGSSVTVVVDTPLSHTIKLWVNQKEVPESSIATKTLDGNIGRQTFEYLGLLLQEGANEIHLESTDDAGNTETETVTVFLAGVPELVTFTPLRPLVAKSAVPLEFEVEVKDAWGNVPADSFVTLEIRGAQPALADANPRLVGYQMAFVNGRGILRLEPLEEPGDITLTALIGRELGRATFAVDSNLRPWIVAGFGSAAIHYHPDNGEFKFGVGASVFARGQIFNDYLLTLAANYPLDPLGDFAGNTSRRFETFPVTGSSGNLSQDAYSQYGVYARLERNQSFVQLGDFSTQLEGYLLALSRAYTGLSFQYQPAPEGFGLRGYASYASPSDRVTDLYIPADGTREYILPDQDIKLDTLQLEVLKGDCNIPRDFVEDSDPLLGHLKQGVDYVVDREGILRLNARLPLTDADGNCYYLRANYQLEPGSSEARVWQYGVQGSYRFGIVTARAGFYQENLLNDAYARVIAAGLTLEGERLKGDFEIAYGQDQAESGIAATMQLGYKQGPLATQATYRFFAEGYRSAVINNARNAGHDLKITAGYALTDNLVLSADTQWRYYVEDSTSQFQSNFLATYRIRNLLTLGNMSLARDPTLQFGVQYDQARTAQAGFRIVAGASVNDIFGLGNTQFSVVHRQGLDTTSMTEFSLAYRILENLTLRVTDRVVWGQTNSLILGLESQFENCDLLGSVTGLCDTLDLGKTRAHAQYELSGGIAGQAGRILLGIDTEIPLSDEVTVNAGLNQNLDFSDGEANETVLSAGIVYDRPEVVRAEVAYDLRFAVDVKHVLFMESMFNIRENAYGNVSVDYISDPAEDPAYGLKFGVAGAYRGERFSMLTSSALRLGQYSENENAEFGGDTRLNFAIDNTWSLRSGYIFDYEESLGYRDLTSLGVSAELWSGGNLSGYGRIYHDWRNELWNLGATLETSQRLGCGVYGVAGLNLMDGVGANDGAVFGEPGLFLRLDVVFDEEWTCGQGSISGQAFIDKNANGVREDDEEGVSGLEIRLLHETGQLIKTTYSGVNGAYSLKARPGSYTLEIRIPQHYGFSTVNTVEASDGNTVYITGQTIPLKLDWGEHLSQIDIGVIQKSESRP